MAEDNQHFEWLVGARFKSQDVLRRLYVFWKDHGDGQDLLSHDHSKESLYTLFVGAAFSLWRAAFLSDTTRLWEGIMKDTGLLLETLLTDNAIGYPQDRKTKVWMGGYYLNNAMFRLIVVRDILRPPNNTPALIAFDKFEKRGIEDKNSSVTWDVLHDALEEMFTWYEKNP